MPWQIRMQSVSEVDRAAKEILDRCSGRKVFAISGEMGSGKTTLIGGLCRQLGIKDHTSSPTFAIANEYKGTEPVFHIDLYRLKNIPEALDAGVDEYLSSGRYCFIEWPEKIEELIPTDAVQLKLEVFENNERLITINH